MCDLAQKYLTMFENSCLVGLRVTALFDSILDVSIVLGGECHVSLRAYTTTFCLSRCNKSAALPGTGNL